MSRPEVLAAAPTMFTADGSLDEVANRRVHERLAGRLDGVLVAGTNGEFPALGDDERIALVEGALAVWGPDRVVAHVGSPATARAVALTARAVAVGARRLAALPPYYFEVDAADVEAHFRAVHEAAAGVPVYAYVFPERTAVSVGPELLGRLAGAAIIAGVKLSGAAAARLEDYVAALPTGLPIWSGADVDIARVSRAGARGVVSGLSAALPGPFVALQDALARDDRPAIERETPTVRRIAATLGGAPRGIKVALAALGLGAADCRMLQGPGARVDPAAIHRLVSDLSDPARDRG